jgi:hypothetical protein
MITLVYLYAGIVIPECTASPGVGCIPALLDMNTTYTILQINEEVLKYEYK